MFVDREDEIFDVEDALAYSRVVGVHGTLGVGKSSFLRKLSDRITTQGHALAFVHLTADSRESFYREMLRQVLLACKDGTIVLKRGHGVDIHDELVLLDTSITDTLGSALEGGVIAAKGKIDKSRATRKDSHTESTAIQILAHVFANLKGKLIVILDDFEKLQYASSSTSGDYLPLLSRFVSTLEDRLSHDSVSFVVSLDDQFTVLADQTKKRGGAFAFSLNALVQLRNFSPQRVIDLIDARLRHVGWKKSVFDFIPLESFWALSLASQNHPRRILRILAESMKIITKHKRPMRIDSSTLSEAALATEDFIDDRDLQIIYHLAQFGGASESDRAFLKALGFKSRSAISRRLSHLQDAIHLQTQKVRSGRTQKIVYLLPELHLP